MSILATRYAAASDLTPDAILRIWRAIPAERQEEIGTKVLEAYLAELVADDDGLISTEAERVAARSQHDTAFNQIHHVVEAAMPSVLWYYPEAYEYEVRDRHGNLLGFVDQAGEDRYRFEPVSPRMRRGFKVADEPVKALPRWARKAVEAGGRFCAVMPDGRRYPDDFRPIAACVTATAEPEFAAAA